MDFYDIKGKKESQITFDELFNEWKEYKKSFINVTNRKKSMSPATIARYNSDYERYIKPLKLSSLKLNSLTAINIQKNILEMIEDNSLSEKNAGNIIGYITQMLQYAYLNDYISKDLASKIDRKLLLANTRVSEKEDNERILSIEQFFNLKQTVLQQEAKNPLYAPNYAIELAMLTGMRTGEIAALRWSDIGENDIFIQYSEHLFKYDDERKSETVIGDTKNGKHRHIPITDDMKMVFEKIKKQNFNHIEDFIFVNQEGVRHTGHDISCASARRGDEAGVSKVCIHRIRRTVSSQLNTILPQKDVASILGHTEQVNENHYNYSTLDNNDKMNALNKISGKIIKFNCNPANNEKLQKTL